MTRDPLMTSSEARPARPPGPVRSPRPRSRVGRFRRRGWLWLVSGVLAVLAAVTLTWFQPQKLFYDQRVDEALPGAATETTSSTAGPGPVSAAEPQPLPLASGTFVSREHETSGTARVLRLPDGQVIVRFEGFATSNGPVLVVWLSRAPAHAENDAFGDDHVVLGALKGNVGDQNYVIPAGLDPLAYTSVVVWCDRFHVAFGAADLTPPGCGPGGWGTAPGPPIGRSAAVNAASGAGTCGGRSSTLHRSAAATPFPWPPPGRADVRRGRQRRCSRCAGPHRATVRAPGRSPGAPPAPPARPPSPSRRRPRPLRRWRSRIRRRSEHA